MGITRRIIRTVIITRIATIDRIGTMATIDLTIGTGVIVIIAIIAIITTTGNELT
jgi:hypothetical protein